MSLQAKILSLLSGIVGVNDRIGIAGSIMYIADLYMSGRMSEDQARTEIFDICYTVIRSTRFELTEDEVRKYANRMTEEIMMSVKLEGLRRRPYTTLRPAPRTSERRTFPF